MRRTGTAMAALSWISIVLAPIESIAQPPDVPLKNPCVANILGALGALEGGASNHIYTQDMIFPNVPRQLTGFATTPHRNTNSITLLAIPLDNAQYEALFGAEPSGARAAEMAEARSFADRDGLLATTTVRERAGFQALLKNTSDTFVIVAGHNENGEFFFYGGKSAALPLLAEDCARAAKVCIFVSCRSSDHLKDGSVGISRNLTYTEGVYVATKIRRWLTTRPEASIADVAAYARSVELQANFRFNVSYFAMAACAAAGTPAVAYIIIEGAQPANSQRQ